MPEGWLEYKFYWQPHSAVCLPWYLISSITHTYTHTHTHTWMQRHTCAHTYTHSNTLISTAQLLQALSFTCVSSQEWGLLAGSEIFYICKLCKLACCLYEMSHIEKDAQLPMVMASICHIHILVFQPTLLPPSPHMHLCACVPENWTV